MIFNINSTRGQTRFLTCIARVTCLVRLRIHHAFLPLMKGLHGTTAYCHRLPAAYNYRKVDSSSAAIQSDVAMRYLYI